MHGAFIEALVARGPHPSLGPHAQTYARIIGSWVGEIHNHMHGSVLPSGSVEAHFAWVLEGRAVQDVWITPARGDRTRAGRSGGVAELDWYGSTLRVFDAAEEAWHTVWTDPVSRLRIELVGRRQGEDIVQIGTRGGRPIRWRFFDLRPETLSWQGDILNFDGKSWDREVSIEFRRQA